MGLLTTPGARTVSFRLLGLSLVLLLVADHVYALQNLEGTYVSGGWIDSLYLVAYLVFGASALHPSMRRLTDPHPVAVTWLGPVRLACLAAAMITGPILVTVGPHGDGGLIVVAVGTALLSLLVLMRLAGLVGLLERDVAARRVLEARLTYQAYPRPADGSGQPTPVRRRHHDRARQARGARGRWPCCSWTSTTSRPSTTASATPPATNCWRPWPSGSVRASGTRTSPRGSVATSSACSSSTCRDEAYASAAAERLLDALEEPIDVAGLPVTIGASIGVAFDSSDTAGVDDLLGKADIAMYRAKAQGKGRHHVFSPDDLIDNEAAAGRVLPDEPIAAPRRGLSLRKPTVRRPAFGPEPG